MKRVLSALFFFMLAAAPVQAAVHPYFAGSVGTGVMVNTDLIVADMTFRDYVTYKAGVPRVAAIGIISDYRRFEAAFIQQLNDVDTVKFDGIHPTSVTGRSVTIASKMVNVYRDFPQPSGWAWYLMGGIGSSDVTITSPTTVTKERAFTWQAGSGVGIKLSKHLVIDCGYRYIKPSNVKISGTDFTYASHNVMIGSRLSF